MVIELNELKKSFKFVGFDHTNGKHDIKLLLFLSSLLAVLINTLLFVIYKWENVDNRVNGLKAVTFYLIFGMYSMVFVFNWEDLILTIKIIDEGHFKFPYTVTKERSNLLDQIQRDMLNINTFWYYAINFYLYFGIIAPIVVFLLTAVMGNMREINVEKLILPFPFYYPENYKNILTYFIGYFVQTTFYVFVSGYGYLTISVSLVAMTAVEGELKLLRLSVHEMENFLMSSSDPDKKLENKENETSDVSFLSRKEHLLQMKSFSRYIVNHHHDIYRKIKDVTKGIQGVAFFLNSGVSIYLCMTIYIIVQKDELLFKIQEAVFCFLWAYDIYCYDLMGEKIATEDENLRRELYFSGWIDKPKWFKNELYIMMTRINKSVEIKPVGLFTLNLRNFAVSVNAAYSYYNVLHNLNH